MIGAEGGIRTLTGLLPTEFKSVARVLTSFYYALPSSIYRRFSRQSKLRLVWYQHVTLNGRAFSRMWICASRNARLDLQDLLKCFSKPVSYIIRATKPSEVFESTCMDFS